MRRLDVLKLKKEEAQKKLNEFKEELFKLNSMSLGGEDTAKKKAKLRALKKNIARVKTIINTK